jgi:DNA-binding SARP family transcriptional activator
MALRAADDDSTGARVRLRLLGGFGLSVGGEERGAAVPTRVRSLLAYLALRPDVVHDRQTLAFAFWPDSTEGQARTNLRNVLHHLKRAGPELKVLVESTPSTLYWNARSRTEVDVFEFRAALDAAEAVGAADEVAALRLVVARYGGDLLAGSYEEWLEPDRSRLREQFLGALRRLTEILVVGADPSAAIETSRDLVRGDPLNEDHHRLRIVAHAATGDRAGAVRAFHECVAVLDQELGVKPSATTRHAYAEALRDEAAPAPEPIESPSAAPPALVGRDREWGEITECWRATLSTRRPHIVVVAGEAGIGKTRLVEDLAACCARQEAVVALARSYAAEGELGFGAVIEWLRSPGVVPGLADLGSADRTELARLLPELGDGDATSPGAVTDVDRLRLFGSATRALTASGRPLLLVADDAHWCDVASLQLVHYLVRSHTGPLLVAATARREDLDDHHPLADTIGGLRAIDRSTEIELGRLTVEETASLATALGVASIGWSIEHLYRETEGNPLFVVEAVRAGWDGQTDRVDLSPRLRAVIDARLRRLGDRARAVLAPAAVAGRAFTARLVGRAAGLDDLSLARGLDELWRRGVIRGHEPDGYDFTHGKLREAAYDALTPAIQRRLHARLAEALATTAPDPLAASGQVAAHLDRAGRSEEAIGWYRRAAAQALRMGASDEAVRLLERARSLAATLPGPTGLPLELDILCSLPAALGGVDGYASDRLSDVQARAAAVAGQLGVGLEPPMLKSLVMSSLCRDEFETAAEAAERLRVAGTAAGDEGLEVESRYLLGVIAFWAGDLTAAEARFREVIERFDHHRRADHVVRFGHDPGVVCLSRLANTLWLLGRRDEAEDARDRALALVAEHDDRVTINVTHLFGALLALDLDDTDAFRLRAIHFLDDPLRSGVHLLVGSAILGVLDALEGRADRGISRIEAAIEGLGGRNLAPSSQPIMHRLLVTARSVASDPAATVVAADSALALGGTRLWEPEIRRLRALALAGLHRPAAEVAAELDRAASAASRLGANGPAAKVDATRHGLDDTDRTSAPPTAR